MKKSTQKHSLTMSTITQMYMYSNLFSCSSHEREAKKNYPNSSHIQREYATLVSALIQLFYRITQIMNVERVTKLRSRVWLS